MTKIQKIITACLLFTTMVIGGLTFSIYADSGKINNETINKAWDNITPINGTVTETNQDELNNLEILNSLSKQEQITPNEENENLVELENEITDFDNSEIDDGIKG